VLYDVKFLYRVLSDLCVIHFVLYEVLCEPEHDLLREQLDEVLCEPEHDLLREQLDDVFLEPEHDVFLEPEHDVFLEPEHDVLETPIPKKPNSIHGYC
jgi:hypothetical protein